MFDRAANDNDAAEHDEPAPRRPSSDSPLRRFTTWAMIGIALGLVLASIALRQIYLDPTPTLTPALFHTAHERWLASPLPNYDIEIRVTGPQSAVYRVEVREGEPQTASRNGQPLNSRRTFGTWSVPGMFSTISRDIEALERAAANKAQIPLILRASFNVPHGYPEHYRRIDNGSRKGGDSIAVTWDVTEFRVIEP